MNRLVRNIEIEVNNDQIFKQEEYIMHNKLKLLLVFLVVVIVGSCSEPPVALDPNGENDTSDADVDSDGDTDSIADTSTDIDVDADADTDGDVDGDGDSDGDTDADPDEACPEKWACVEFTTNNTCHDYLPNWVRNYNYSCGNSAEICCQPPDAELKKECNQQPAMSCEDKCEGIMVQNNDFYCTNDLKVCCEDPRGPELGCLKVNGICIDFYENCPESYSEVDNSCGFSRNCCLPPKCPWNCEVHTGPNTCAESSQAPGSVHNRNYSCDKGEICCQPPDDSDGIGGACSSQPDSVCRPSCEDEEIKNKAFYCKNDDMFCCMDMRKDCAELGGTCDGMAGVCISDDFEPNDRGKCDGLIGSCCTPATANNDCVNDGYGRCVNIGEVCPLPYILPDPLTSCGAMTKMCCTIPMT
ncbi:MAG: hypothetical protein GY847_18745 [Proteobacteria bacterium]|nr:hypothetical protein [Pseudomonadota bacterium]